MGPNPQETADLVTFTEEILNGKLHFLCSDVIRHTQTVNQIAEFLADKHRNFLHVGTKYFGERGQACPDSQSNCRIFRSAIYPGGRDGLP